MPPPPNADLGYTAYIRVTPTAVAGAALIGLIATVLASLVPAIRVARMHIATALRQMT
jgi:putative ABC transport system permease protein